ncbi:MAG TPA: 16S rRNA (guanine(966)-N(2))-methyltransferase RsmD [Rhodobacteraceae bacterium]|nr:16S rRNA (guanine(966)-N(2))-methyltransferase RsmD [Paracoccaceae bacterium]
MRIIAGDYRGRALTPVGKGDPSAHLRPTTDRVRESLFNVLAGGRFGDAISGISALDLFAGTGALGLEALSRGAADVTFVDDGKAALKLIRRNVALCNAQETTTILRRDARRLGPRPIDPFGLVFLDPPYGMGWGEAAFASAQAGGWIASDALVVWEENTAITIPEACELLDTRRYGDTTISILQYQS